MAVKKVAKKVAKFAKPARAKVSHAGGTGVYDASAISVLEGLDPVRRRPGMYIGTTGTDGLHHLVWEVFDNSRDEAMGGFADRVEVALLPGNYVRVVDNGRGIPVDRHKQTKTSALETIMTTLHAGGKFGDVGYKVSGGLHGVGVSVVNALSTHLIAEVHRDGAYHIQEYKIGDPKAKVKKVGPSKLEGTIITFQPDDSIFNEVEYDYKRIVGHLRQQAYLVKGMKITVIDAREMSPEDEKKLDLSGKQYLSDENLEVPSETFYFEGGLKSLVAFNNQYQKPVHKNIFYVEKQDVDSAVLSVEVALQYVDDISSRILAFANNIYNAEDGTHITGFKTALTRTLNNYAKKNNLIKDKDTAFTGDDVLEGITAVVSIKMPEIQFEGQTKGKLGSVEARGAVESVFGEAFTNFLEEKPDDAKAIINKVIIAVKARKAAKAAKDSVLRKGALEGMSLPGKLADCQSKSAEESELFIVEGDSAGGCWSGDTKVALADGRNITFKKLVEEHKKGKKNFCYTMKNDGYVGIAPILYPRKTKQNAQVIKVVLDTGVELRCTPDHLFRLVDGNYVSACKLTPKHNLAPLYRKISKKGEGTQLNGYEMVFEPRAKKWMLTHILSDIYNLENDIYQASDGSHRHHVDFNKRNNNPTNIQRVTYEQHMSIHYAYMEGALHRSDVKQKSIEAKRTPEYRKKARLKSLEKRELFSKNVKKQWENPEYKEYMRKKYQEFYDNNPKYQEENRSRLNKAQRIHWAKKENRIAQSERTTLFFRQNPERRKELSVAASQQWDDVALRAWRSEKTKTQWTDEFRKKRTLSYNQTYLNKMLRTLNDIYQETGEIDFKRYEIIRAETRDRSLIRPQTVADRFYDGDLESLKEAAAQYNHRVLSVEWIKEYIDVYDFEVLGTHNFALASGVFVHNSAKMGRDRRTQAILPLRGKILNVERARIDKMLGNEQIKNLVIALGTAIGDVFDISKLRYHKVIIATDADVDGAHIRTLLLTLLYRYFKPLVEGGYIYIAQPPLYKIQRGKEIMYAYTDKEKFDLLGEDAPNNDTIEMDDDETQVENESSEVDVDEVDEEKEVDSKKSPKVRIQRYKGLGEMNADELWETTMNPENRLLLQVTIEDAQEADKVFDILMGTDVAGRKSFIQSNAHMANLDI